MDETYGEAFYVLGLIAERAGEKELAEEYFEKAGRRAMVRKPTPARSKRQNSGAVAAPLFRSSPANFRRLITGGDRRLAEALRQDALSACNSADIVGR
jgi:hypothetical protein